MKENINFLDIIEIERKRSQTMTLNNTPKETRTTSFRKNKFPFFKAMHFTDNKFEQYPKWLTNR